MCHVIITNERTNRRAWPDLDHVEIMMIGDVSAAQTDWPQAGE